MNINLNVFCFSPFHSAKSGYLQTGTLATSEDPDQMKCCINDIIFWWENIICKAIPGKYLNLEGFLEKSLKTK